MFSIFCLSGFWSQTVSGSLGKRKRLLLCKTKGYRNSLSGYRTGEWSCKKNSNEDFHCSVVIFIHKGIERLITFQCAYAYHIIFSWSIQGFSFV